MPAIDPAALRTLIAGNPEWAALAAKGDFIGLAAVLNARTAGMVQPLPHLALLQFTVSMGLRGSIEAAANDPSQSSHGECLGLRDLFWGVGTNHVFDLTDPAVAGAGGLLDGLVNATPTPIMSADDKAALIQFGTVPASPVEVQFGYGTVVTVQDIANTR
jgi:hypothetical protein